MVLDQGECLCCGGSALEVHPAVIAPFIADYVLAQRPTVCELAGCNDCGFQFFTSRFTQAECARLYSGYRGPEYFSRRRHHEPWYSRRVNEEAGHDPRVRRLASEQFLRRAPLELGSVRRVLDYGGGDGALIPDGLAHAERFVYDLSVVPARPDVRKVSAPRESGLGAFDLVLASHLLEHVPDPRRLVEELRGCLSPGGALYVEVPFEVFRFVWPLPHRLSERYLRALLALRPLFLAVDVLSLAARLKLGIVPPLGIVKLHEHLSFFSLRSLERLLARGGFTCVHSELAPLGGASGRSRVLRCLATAS